jgi:hypothetical protein
MLCNEIEEIKGVACLAAALYMDWHNKSSTILSYANHWFYFIVQYWCCVIENPMGVLTSTTIIHKLEYFCILACAPIFLQYSMLAHQETHEIQESTVIKVINNNQESCWLNESKYLWNVLMCPWSDVSCVLMCPVSLSFECSEITVRQKRRLCIVFAVQVSGGAMRHAT